MTDIEPVTRCSCGAPTPCIAPRFGGQHVSPEVWQGDQIDDGMFRWEPGTLSTHVLNRLLIDVLADIWSDCYRRDMSVRQRRDLFCEKATRAVVAATGEGFRVV